MRGEVDCLEDRREDILVFWSVEESEALGLGKERLLPRQRIARRDEQDLSMHSASMTARAIGADQAYLEAGLHRCQHHGDISRTVSCIN